MPSDLEFVLERHPTSVDPERRDAAVPEATRFAPDTPTQALLTVADVLALVNSHAAAISAIAEAKKVVETKEVEAVAITGRLDAIGMVIGSERLQTIMAQAAAPRTAEAIPEPPQPREVRDTAVNETEEAPTLSGAQGEETRGKPLVRA